MMGERLWDDAALGSGRVRDPVGDPRADRAALAGPRGAREAALTQGGTRRATAVAERITRRTDDLSGRSFLYLASRSPRRRLLLAQLRIPHATLDIEVDECWDGREAPCRYVCRLALAKAEAGGSLLGVGPAPVLAADTAVVLDGAILGKPQAPRRGAGRARTPFGALS